MLQQRDGKGRQTRHPHFIEEGNEMVVSLTKTLRVKKASFEGQAA